MEFKQKQISTSERPELFFALAGPLGAGLTEVSQAITDSLSEVGYKTQEIHLAELLHQFRKWKNLPLSPEDTRITLHMDAGNKLRKTLKRGDALALVAINQIRDIRYSYWRKRFKRPIPPPQPKGPRDFWKYENKPVPNLAFLLRSLKHPDEARLLRQVYCDAFHLISAYSPRESRVLRLAKRIADSKRDPRSDRSRPIAQSLIQRDEKEEYADFGQNMRDTFSKADLFVDVGDPEEMRISVQRYVQLLFRHPSHSPSRQEYGMFFAQSAAFRSADLSRQVGAAIVDPDGSIISVGTNEVPKAGGGQYWNGDEGDARDFRLGADVGTTVKKTGLFELLEKFYKKRLLHKGILDLNAKTFKKNKEQEILSLIGDGTLMQVGEFARTVHAEMAALMDAARRGVRVDGATLYTTTFPCHVCARHIVAAGIRQVIYTEPYPKSFAQEHHSDSIKVDVDDSEPLSRFVHFKQFSGISSRRYFDLFPMLPRKEQGEIITWAKRKQEALPRYPDRLAHQSYILREASEDYEFHMALKKQRLALVRSGKRPARRKK